jgi:addiction module RelB/DinJ family antitoxin
MYIKVCKRKVKMPETALVQAKMDARLKAQMEKIVTDLGLDVPTVIRLFFKQTVNRGELPFNLVTTRSEQADPCGEILESAD